MLVSPNLPTNIVGFNGFDSSTILIKRGGIPRFIGDLPESLTQATLVGTMSVGGLGGCLGDGLDYHAPGYNHTTQ